MASDTIVVVEDEPDISEVIEYNLRREGFTVVSCRDGDDGLARVRAAIPDLVLLDLMLPGMDGLELCRRLKNDVTTRQVPIIMVSAKGEESDVVLGLGLGADDYVVKPFSPKELVARVRAVLRRTRTGSFPELPERLDFGGLAVDAGTHEVTVDGRPVEMTATEFRLLHHLASRTNRVFTREQLIRHAIGEDVVVLERNIDVHVRSLRKKLGPYRDMIKTIRGVGYRFLPVPE